MEVATEFQSLSRDSGRLNSAPAGAHSGLAVFQSLSRDSGRLNSEIAYEFEMTKIGVSIPQSGFGAFERSTHSSRTLGVPYRFNPSVGIRGV